MIYKLINSYNVRKIPDNVINIIDTLIIYAYSTSRFYEFFECEYIYSDLEIFPSPKDLTDLIP